MRVQCLNCGQPAGPHFCGHCGQAVESHRSPLQALAREFIEEIVSVDGRFVRTLRALLHPGLLTINFLQGKRAAFVSPVRLYLLTSVALFSTALSLATPSADSINLFIADELMNPPLDARRSNVSIVNEGSAMGTFLRDQQAENLARLKSLPSQVVLDRIFGGLRQALPTALIVFVPFLALALKVLYFRQHTLYVDHLVFSAHFQAAFFVALVAGWLVQRLISVPVLASMIVYTVIALLMLLWYLPIALQRVYKQHVSLTIVKTLVLLVAYLQVLANVVGIAVLLVLRSVSR